MHLRCELNTLGYPKAALFAFCVAVCSYNLLATIKGALRGVHGEEKMKDQCLELLPDGRDQRQLQGNDGCLAPKGVGGLSNTADQAMAAQLKRWARSADLANYPKHPRGPKKPKKKCPNAQFHHVSTWKLLEERSQKKRRKQKLARARP